MFAVALSNTEHCQEDHNCVWENKPPYDGTPARQTVRLSRTKGLDRSNYRRHRPVHMYARLLTQSRARENRRNQAVTARRLTELRNLCTLILSLPSFSRQGSCLFRACRQWWGMRTQPASCFRLDRSCHPSSGPGSQAYCG